jgi:hypothetical protein
MAPMPSGTQRKSKMPKLPKRKETPALHLPSELGTVQVFRPKNCVTIVTDVDDIDMRDGSLLLLKRAPNGRETCMMVFKGSSGNKRAIRFVKGGVSPLQGLPQSIRLFPDEP